MIEVLTPPSASAPQRATLRAALTLAVAAARAATKTCTDSSSRRGRGASIRKPIGRSGSPERQPGVSMKGITVVLVVVLMLLAFAGCGQVRDQNGSARAVLAHPAKASFVIAADRICAGHLETVLAWLEQARTGDGWQERATRDDGIYRIMADTIQRLEMLGPPPGPIAGAFAGYVATLKARAALYRLTGMAELRRDRLFAMRLQRRVDQIDGVGDRDGHRYGLRICGAGPRDLAKAPGEAGAVGD
jgi:hypothetical protein